MSVGPDYPATATVMAANGDRRYDAVAWRSDRPAVLSVEQRRERDGENPAVRR